MRWADKRCEKAEEEGSHLWVSETKEQRLAERPRDGKAFVGTPCRGEGAFSCNGGAERLYSEINKIQATKDLNECDEPRNRCCQSANSKQCGRCLCRHVDRGPNGGNHFCSSTTGEVNLGRR
jgi:hypothetical protein